MRMQSRPTQASAAVASGAFAAQAGGRPRREGKRWAVRSPRDGSYPPSKSRIDPVQSLVPTDYRTAAAAAEEGSDETAVQSRDASVRGIEASGIAILRHSRTMPPDGPALELPRPRHDISKSVAPPPAADNDQNLNASVAIVVAVVVGGSSPSDLASRIRS